MPIYDRSRRRVAGKLKSWRRFLATALASCAVVALAQGRQDDPKFSGKAESTAKRLSQQIRDEMSQIKNHEWAGEYYKGDGLGENVSLLIAPKHGYVFQWRGCLGLYDRNYGSVTATNGRIQLSFTFTNKQEGFEGIASEFIPIRWGKRTYLVPTTDMVGFCNEVNSGSEPRKNPHGVYLLRRGDENKNVVGNPAVPAEYRVCLFKQPVEASITKIGKTSTRPSRADFKFRDTHVTINAGANQNLRTGIELYVTSPRHLVETVELVKVRETESDGVITQTGDNDPAPTVGWKLSTRAPWR